MSENNTTVVPLRPVDIKPADFKDPATMLRNIADEIEKGKHGDVSTLAVVMFTEGAENGDLLAMFGGGRDSDPYHVATAYGAAQVKLLRVLSGDTL